MAMEQQKPPRPLAVIIMAAGKGTRMKNPDMAKVMYEIQGKPMVDYVVDLSAKLLAKRTILIVGWKKESVIEYIAKAYPGVEFRATVGEGPLAPTRRASQPTVGASTR